MACLQPYLRIRLGTKKWRYDNELIDGEERVIPHESGEDGIVNGERARVVIDLPSNRQKLEESNIQYDVIPCGYCDYCYKKRVKDWSLRILNETKYHSENYFVTLTYDDAHLPKNNSVDKKAVQKFFHRVKDWFRNNVEGTIKFKYYCVAEYGEGQGQRNYINPHYHFISFGLPLINFGLTDIHPDGHPHYSKSGDKLLFSPLLSKLWPDGFVTIQEVTFGSAAYVAGYVHKKLKESKPIIHEEISFMKAPDGRSLAFIVPRRYNPYDALGIEKPFSLMSKGIGEQYIKDNYEKIYETDEMFFNSGKFGVMSTLPPRYYDKKHAVHNPEKAKLVLDKRKELANSTITIDNDSQVLYNRRVKADLAAIKQSNRKRGLTHLS